MTNSSSEGVGGPVSDTIKDVKTHLIAAAVFSGVINILALTGSIFMLQVYDRALTSRSLQTLLALCLLVLVLYAINALLEGIRSRLFARIGRHFELKVRESAFEAHMRAALPGSDQSSVTALRDLEQVRSFLASGAPSALFDLPWMPFYCVILFVLHPYLGALGLVGVISLSGLTWLSDRASSPIQSLAGSQANAASSFADSLRISAETIIPMGLHRPMKSRWLDLSARAGETIIDASDTANFYGGISKWIRLSLQSMVLALGAYLVIQGEATGGVMIAASILLGRALAPVEQAIGHWRGYLSGKEAFARLQGSLHRLTKEPSTALPAPTHSLKVKGLTLARTQSEAPILTGLSFEALAGDCIGVIGPSGSGKSTLVRALIGLWPTAAGQITFDGAALNQWSLASQGEFIGYLPQSVELFSGTIRENISRFNAISKEDELLAASAASGTDGLIRSQEGGFDAQVGQRGSFFSMGQRQRIGLARALYGNPFLVILDEPNSALDSEGEKALLSAVAGIKERGGIALLIAHRPNMLQVANKVLVLAEGRQQAFGLRDEVLQKVLQPQGQPT
jgi:PrtD family type I secretion system ABC transporter